MSSMIITPTPITNIKSVDKILSPKYIEASSLFDFTHVQLNLWVWSGNLNTPYVSGSNPDIVLYKQKVSSSDSYILFEISDYIKPYLNPIYLYNADLSLSSNEAVFYQYELLFIDNPDNLDVVDVVDTQTPATRVATLGYNWNFNASNTGFNNNSFADNILSPINGFKYSNKIKYFTPSFDLDSVTNTEDLIVREPLIVTEDTCLKEYFLIIYLDSDGLFRQFMPTGKILVDDKIEREDYERTVRNPLNNSYALTHYSKRNSINVRQTWTINTGLIKEFGGSIIEEIVYSPIVYLIQFQLVTLDGVFNNWIQIPVKVTDTSFTRKTRINDKVKISYLLKLEETSNKIYNIR